MAQKSKSLVIAEYFINKSQMAGKAITNKKVQKLLYYAQAWSLVFSGKKIFDDQIEAWVHGPAIPSIYFEFKKFGFGNISITINEGDFADLSDEEGRLLDNVWNAYGKFDADYLELLTHNEEPWQMARGGCTVDEYCNNEINTDLMKEYYGRRLEEIKKG